MPCHSTVCDEWAARASRLQGLAGNLSFFFERKLKMLCNELVKELPTTYLNHLGMGFRLVFFPSALPGY